MTTKGGGESLMSWKGGDHITRRDQRRGSKQDCSGTRRS